MYSFGGKGKADMLLLLLMHVTYNSNPLNMDLFEPKDVKITSGSRDRGD